MRESLEEARKRRKRKREADERARGLKSPPYPAVYVFESYLRSLVRGILMEGGAYGHLTHLYEALDMTFGDLLGVLRAASEGKLENVTEKTDGINMFFTVAEGELRVATNPGFIRTGGMNREELAAKYADKPPVQQAYVSGYDALSQAVKSVPSKQQKRFFGAPHARTWYSVEVITSGLSMTIKYGRNILAVHLNGSKTVNADGSEQPGDHKAAQALGQMLERVGKVGDWEVRGPAMVELPAMAKDAFQRAEQRVRALGVGDADTVQDFLAKRARADLAAAGAKPPALDPAARKMAGFPGSPNLTTFKKQIPAQAYSLMQNTKDWAKDAILPLEDIVTDFAVERLRGVDSALMDDSQAEVQRLRGLVEKAIAAIQASGDDTAMQVLQREMVKLKSAENIVTPMEGIVFHYKGRVLKLTGAFSSFHKILALFSFGKGGTKLTMGEGKLAEGGHALAGAQPVPLDAFEREFPLLADTLKRLGAKKVVPVGSTGKKPLMGDVDLAVETDLTIEEFQKKLEAEFGKDLVTRNATVVSFAYDFDGVVGQVDLMFGKASYLSWARAGTDPRKTPFKGVARNLLLNILARVLSDRAFDKQTATMKKRYVVDMDRGLFINTQTKVSKDGKPLKDWKTTDREFVTDVPDEIVSVLLGEDFVAKDTLTFEDLARSIARSKLVKPQAKDIMRQFVDSVRETAAKRPDVLGPDTLELMDRVEREYL